MFFNILWLFLIFIIFRANDRGVFLPVTQTTEMSDLRDKRKFHGRNPIDHGIFFGLREGIWSTAKLCHDRPHKSHSKRLREWGGLSAIRRADTPNDAVCRHCGVGHRPRRHSALALECSVIERSSWGSKSHRSRQPKRKNSTTRMGTWVLLVAEMGFEPHDLRVMSW